MTSTTGLFFKLLLILFAYDVLRKYLEKPIIMNQEEKAKNEIKTEKIDKNLEKTTLKTKKTLIDEDDDFIDTKKRRKSIKDDRVQEDDEVAEDDEEKEERKRREKSTKKKNKENELEKNKKEENEDGEQERKDILEVNYDKYLYTKQFDVLRKQIMGNFSTVRIVEKEYPVSETKKYFSKFTFLSQIVISILTFTSSKFKEVLPFIPEGVFNTVNNNKLIFLIGNFLFHQWLNKFLSSSGAFEISYEGNLLYSKLNKKVIPKEKDIHDSLKELLKSTKDIKKESINGDEDF